MLRLNWQAKAMLPVAVVLGNGLLLFLLATSAVADSERRAVLMVAAAGAIIICGVFLLMLALIVRPPIRELQEKIARVRSGDLSITLDFANRNDEIGDLGKAFTQMIGELRESREEIQRLHRTQMSRAEHLATLGELAAGLAHEIRNPLAGIAGAVEVIGCDLPADSPARNVLKDVRQETQRIGRIVSDLLETARPRPPELRSADLNATAEHAVLFARQQVLSRPIEVQLIKDETLPLVEHDTNQIHQVLLNLLLNAIQAIKEKGTVRVELGREDSFAMVSISDTGIGIASKHLPNIFRPFYTTKTRGTGLGLSLARRIIEDHGGRIAVNSCPDVGSEFTLLIPLNHPAAQAAGSE